MAFTMPSRGALGMLLMLLNGVLNSMMVVAGSFAKELEWPYFRLLAASGVVIFASLAALALTWHCPLPDMRQFKWLLLRGGFGSLTFVLMIASVRIGASPGDAAAMASINTVVAALLGRLLLGEQLHFVHGLAVVCSIAGSLLICRPGFLFGTPNPAFVGYIVAAASGFMQACVFISARKSHGTPLLLLNMSPAGFCVIAFGVLPSTPLLEDFSLEPVWDYPLLGLGLVAAYAVLLAGGMCTNSAAGMWCPAAVSATMNTGSKMLSGYLAQTLLFAQSPEVITLVGAALMLVAVVIMAAARSVGHEAAPEEKEPSQVETPGAGQSTASQEQGEEEETESLASFIAAEFVASEGGLRQRHATTKKKVREEPEPEVLGTSAAISAVVFSA
mmetsp:Transcript_12053/g.22127  ORF Transcript_12053/g.22127 Transcript_12053/m.22127 type:complete len:388 (+) Transcript_12053:70-1233(+)